jgi:hypothetical protein
MSLPSDVHATPLISVFQFVRRCFTTSNYRDVDIADTRPLVSDECQRTSVGRYVERRIANSARRASDLTALQGLAIDLEDPIRNANAESRLDAPEMPELLHPRMADVYRENVGSLSRALESEERRAGL